MVIFKSRAFVRKILGEIRASYWFWPMTLVIGAFILAQTLVWIETGRPLLVTRLPDWMSAVEPAGARSTLSTVATAMIGVAGVLFSMTLVAVSFAADTFGPRLIGNFMRDRGTQITFGLLLGTFVFTIVILRSVQDGSAPFVPYLGLAAALSLTLMCIFAIIYYIHHVPETINVSNIASDLGLRFGHSIRSLIDERAAYIEEPAPDVPQGEGQPVNLLTTGYIQQTDREALLKYSKDYDCVLTLCCETGDFITPHTPVLRVRTQADLTGKQIKFLQDAFATGNARTEAQSTTFIADQMVEMIARALSPGFNDPFTAINCLNWLHAGLLDALIYKDGLGQFETHRVQWQHLDFETLFKASFGVAAHYTVTDEISRDRHLELTQDLMKWAEGDARQVIAALLPRLRRRPADLAA